MRSRENTEGAVPQAMMEQHPSARGTYSYTFPLRGVVKKVCLKDDPENNSGETVCDVALLDGYPSAYKVPLSYSYINGDEGEEWTPKEGDIAVVQFIAANKQLPIITGFLTPRQQRMTATVAEAPRSHRKRNGTWEMIEKDGTRRVKVALSELMEVTQDWLVNVINGVTTLISKGKITLKSEGGIDLDGTGAGALKGVVQGDCICAYSGKPHPMRSSSVNSSL
jgi:hypothetical protein